VGDRRGVLRLTGIAEPTRRLDPGARTLWRLEAALGAVPAIVAGVILAMALEDELPAPVPTLLWAVPVLAALVSAVIVPEVRWRRFRYEVREEEIDLLRGVVTITRTLVPMQRVQHVDVQRGALERLLGFSSVVFHTAAGGNRIPALRPAEATAVRDRIATLTRTPDEL
jgi:membrane protein YdbS with pleckstrin-like domain